MKRLVLILAAGLVLGAVLPRQAHGQNRADVTTKRIRAAEARLKTERDPAERQRLLEEIETYKHELGPTDSTGAPIQCQAMWHQTALEAIELEQKRLAARGKPAGGTAVAMEGRTHIRRMAQVCLRRGWVYGGYLPKYQFDAYGQYLYNNIGLVDGMFDTVAAALVKEASPGPPGPEREAVVAALAQAKDGIARMGTAVEQFANATAHSSREREVLVGHFAAFHQALETVYEAEPALREFLERQKKTEAATGAATAGAGGAASPAGQAQATPADEGPSAEEKAALEKVRAVAATLEAGTSWEKTKASLERYAAVAEQGLKVATARPGAQELLEALGQTAAYVEGLKKSKSAYPEHVAARQGSLETAFEYLADKRTRQYGYSRLRRLYEGDQDRRQIDAGPLSPEASQGMLRSCTISSSAFTGTAGYNSYSTFRYALDAILPVLGKMRDWPPKDLGAPLLPLYQKCHEFFVQAAETAGKATAEDTEALKKAYWTAGVYAKDLDRVVRADQAIRAVAQYLPARGPPMYADLAKKIDAVAGVALTAQMQERPRLDLFLAPFQELALLRVPGPEHQATAMKLSGGAYRAAQSVFNKQMANALMDASKGNSAALDSALEARYMFNLVRHRAVAETDGLAKAGVTNLDAFSLAPKTWTAFVATVDQHLAKQLGLYCNERIIRTPQCQFLSRWDAAYCWVGAAQRLTLADRHAGESDLDVLMRNLAGAADPTPPDTAWFGWAVGYHAVETMTCLMAGYPATAGWHAGELHLHRVEKGFDRELSAAVADPPK